MAEDKSKTVIVKDRARAFLTSKPEEETAAAVRRDSGKTKDRASQIMQKTGRKPVPKASEIAAAIRKGEIPAPEPVKTGGASLSGQVKAPADMKTPMAGQGTAGTITGMINRKNKLVEDNKVKKIPACKMAEPMKKPADDTLIIAGRVTAAGKKIQTPAAAAKSEAKPAVAKAAGKKEPVKEIEKEAEKPAVKKAEPKKEAAKPAAKTAEPKKEAAKPAAKKAGAFQQNTYIQYQNDTFEEAELVAKAEKIWTGDMKKKAADLKSLELYVKPQEKMAYCVFNKKETGSFAI